MIPQRPLLLAPTPDPPVPAPVSEIRRFLHWELIGCKSMILSMPSPKETRIKAILDHLQALYPES